MNVKAKIAGVQLECALFRWNHVKALFAKYVKGCGFFYVHVSECAPRSVAKKLETKKKNMTMYDLFHF